MAYDEIEIDVADGVAELRMNRPSRLNALTATMLGELRAALDDLAARDDVRVAVLTGAGRAFAAGVDLRAFEPDETSLAHGDVGDALNDAARALIERIEAAPFPVIAKVNGACFTGALEIALGCDLIAAAEEAAFGDTHAKLGIRPTWGMTVRLREAVGLRRARELSYTARTFSGKEAGDYGLATIVAPRAELDAAVAELCARIAANSAHSLAAYKRLYRETTAPERDAALATEFGTRIPCPDAPTRVADFVASLGRK